MSSSPVIRWADGRQARPPQIHRPVPRLRASGANQVWSWDITDLPTTVRLIWLYLALVIEVWSRKMLAWSEDSSR